MGADAFIEKAGASPNLERSLVRTMSSGEYNKRWTKHPDSPAVRCRSYQRLLRNFPSLACWTQDQLEIASGHAMSTILNLNLSQNRHPDVLDHDLPFESAYFSIQGQEPSCTTVHDDARETVDYLFYTPVVFKDANGSALLVKLETIGVFGIYGKKKNAPKMPNENEGSDHFSLCADFRMQTTDSCYQAGFSLPPPTKAIQSLLNFQPQIQKKRKNRKYTKFPKTKTSNSESKQQRTEENDTARDSNLAK